MPHNKNIIHIIGHIIYVALYGLIIVFSILFYNSANLAVLLYIGWITLVPGITILLWSSQSRKKGHISEEKGIGKETLVESGMYAFVRHPEFLGHILIIFALVLMAQHVASLVIGALLFILLGLAMVEEEKRDIEKFGDAYKDYMQRVPRINLLTGIIRQMYRETGNEK
ncbi:MAG TPA: isoprenylcysteine carboxylmethyltransferase family protein [Candidatus Methanoperedens sp.]